MASKIPKALKEVWDWEEKIYQETKRLSLKEYFRYIREKAKKILPKGPKEKIAGSV